MKLICLTIAALSVFFSATSQNINSLTEQEKKNGWKLLFNGKDLNNWHAYGKKPIGPRWKINNGVLELHTGFEEGGDLVTNEMLKGDFELKIDWKIGPSSNSGIFFFASESPEYEHIYNSALELQIQDNRVYRDEKEDKQHLTGDLFGVVKAANAKPKPLGEWNQYHVIFKYPMFDVFLNGQRIHHINVNSASWKKLVASKKMPFAQGKFTGPIGLQDWHSVVWFRNIKIKY
jgi:hypothetical protein